MQILICIFFAFYCAEYNKVTSVNTKNNSILLIFLFYEHCHDDSNSFTVVELSVVFMMLSATTVVLNVDNADKYKHSCLNRDFGAGTCTAGLRNQLIYWRWSVNCIFFRWTYFLMFNVSLEISSPMFKVRELWFRWRSRLAHMCIYLHTVYKYQRHSLSLVLRLIFFNYMKPRVFVLHALYFK